MKTRADNKETDKKKKASKEEKARFGVAEYPQPYRLSGKPVDWRLRDRYYRPDPS